MRIVLLILACLPLLGMAECEHSYGTSCLNSLHPFHDDVMDLCFVTCGFNQTFNVTWIPCTDQVMKAIQVEKKAH